MSFSGEDNLFVNPSFLAPYNGTPTPALLPGQDGDLVVSYTNGNIYTYHSGTWNLTATPGGVGLTAFTELTDVPSTYTGAKYQTVRVNATETNLEFFAPIHYTSTSVNDILSWQDIGGGMFAWTATPPQTIIQRSQVIPLSNNGNAYDTFLTGAGPAPPPLPSLPVIISYFIFNGFAIEGTPSMIKILARLASAATYGFQVYDATNSVMIANTGNIFNNASFGLCDLGTLTFTGITVFPAIWEIRLTTGTAAKSVDIATLNITY